MPFLSWSAPTWFYVRVYRVVAQPYNPVPVGPVLFARLPIIIFIIRAKHGIIEDSSIKAINRTRKLTLIVTFHAPY